jgi:hypothetical protein
MMYTNMWKQNNYQQGGLFADYKSFNNKNYWTAFKLNFKDLFLVVQLYKVSNKNFKNKRLVLIYACYIHVSNSLDGLKKKNFF